MTGMLNGGLGCQDEVSTHPSSLTWASPPIESSDVTPTSTYTVTIHSKLVSSPRNTNCEPRPLKRRRRGSEGDENEPSDWNTDDDSFSRFACPFFKRDPTNYGDCFHYKLKRIAYVKQHLKRHHRQPTHCNICLQQLTNEDDLHDHIRAQSCRKREYTAPDGMTALQEKKIVSRAGMKAKPASEQWFEIYEILFPGAPRPPSPYLGDRLSEDIEVLRQFMNQRGSVMVVRELQRENFQWGSGQEPERQLQNALFNVFDEFLSRQIGSRNGANRGRSSRPERISQQREAPASQPTESGNVEGEITLVLDENLD